MSRCVAARVDIIKALQEPEVSNPIMLIRPFSLWLQKAFTLIVTAEASLWTLLLRQMCSLSEPGPWELWGFWGLSKVPTDSTLPKHKDDIAVAEHYNRTRKEKHNSFFLPLTFRSSLITSHWLTRE